jgi:hypothetical protein
MTTHPPQQSTTRGAPAGVLRALRARLDGRQPTLILVAFLLLIVVSPVRVMWSHSDLLLAPPIVLVVLAAVHHSRAGRRVFLLLLGLALTWLASIPSIGLLPIGEVGAEAIMLVIDVVTLIMMVRHMTIAQEPDWETVSAALSGYLLIGATWTQIYALFVALDPTAFAISPTQRMNPDLILYFSYQTLTTLGFGDMAPVNPFVRMFAVVEAIFGQFYVATVIARLVSLARPRRR